MSNHPRRQRSFKTPLTFAQQYGFLTVGTFASALLLGGLLLGWMSFHEKRKMRDLERSGGGTVGEMPPPAESTGSPGTDAPSRVTLPNIFTQGDHEIPPNPATKKAPPGLPEQPR